MKDELKTHYFYIFSGENLLLEKKGSDSYIIPAGETPPFPTDCLLEVMTDEKTVIYTGELTETLSGLGNHELIGLRASYDYIDNTSYQIAGKAYQINYWDKHSRFCPACGTATEHQLSVMKACPNCNYEIYPAISAAILVLIRKEDSVLLIRAKNFRGPFHGLVAGFLETGETLEECVAREVHEEVGLSIKNICYFGNQSWPFPSGLMVGFIADYAGGEIRIQEDELSSAAFYARDNLPEIPRKLSLARKMIDWWLENPS